MEIDDDIFLNEDGTQQTRATRNKISLSVYPQAFLRDYGHIQAKGPLHLIQPTIQRINSVFSDAFNDNFDDLFDDIPTATHIPVVTAISTQMYNEFMHRAATQAGALDVVRGRISGALAAPLLDRATPKNRRMAEVLKRYCNLSLPYARFAERMKVPECPTALRVESVYIIDIKGIPEYQRNGRYVELSICFSSYPIQPFHQNGLRKNRMPTSRCLGKNRSFR